MQILGDHDSATRLRNPLLPSKMMMMIGDPPRPHPTVQIPPFLDDPTAHIHSPDTTSHYDAAFAALQRYLPSNQDDVVHDLDSDDYDIPVDAFSCDDFRMYEFKVKKCARARSHDWTECPFAHPGEKARRRDPRKYHYSGSACPDFRKGACRMGDNCEYAHGVFECWLHPARYRTQPCKDGTHCRRRVCFFAHTPDQLRILSPDSSPGRLGHDSFVLMGSHSPPKTASYSPPSSLSQLSESFQGLRLGKGKMGLGLSMSPPSWGVGFGSPRSPSAVRPGFVSLPTTPIRAVTRSGLSAFDAWEGGGGEEEMVMERVESGKALRERIYAKLGKENSLDRVRRVDSPGTVPDVGWVSELVK